MPQYIPEVTEADIERIVRRDYPPEVHAQIHKWIDAVEMREKTRVIMACLKNSAGDLKHLEGDLHNATGWWREIISDAEYPNYTKKMFHIDRLSAEEQERIIEKDKVQYLEWLHRV